MAKEKEKKNVLYLKTLSGFSARCNGTEIAKGKQGESQMGMLLIMAVHNKNAGVTRNELKGVLFEDRDIEDVSHAIRNILYNIRKMFKSIGMPEGDYIKQKKGVYYWTGEIEAVEDAEVFERKFNEALLEDDPEVQAELFIDNCYRYSGKFLAGLDSTAWVYQESERYREIFRNNVEQAAAYLRRTHKYKVLYELGRYAAKVDPFAEWEVLVMESLTALGRYNDAEELYDRTVDLYINEYGNRSNEYVKSLIEKLGDHLFFTHETIDEIQDKLRSTDVLEGKGYYCPLPVFQELYRTIERTMKRAGDKIFLMLCTIVDSKGNPMKESPKLEELSTRLKNAIVTSVRNTDTVTKYGHGQYLVLLINTTKDNCEVVEKRINSKYIVRRQRTGVAYSVNGLSIESKELPFL